MSNVRTRPNTWTVYKAHRHHEPGKYPERKIAPGGGYTDIITESWDYGDHGIPEVGDRVRDYGNPTEPGNGITHGKDSDWVVVEVEKYASFDGPMKIVVCYCEFVPIPEVWEELNQVAPTLEDSFGGDEEAYQLWRETLEKEPATIA